MQNNLSYFFSTKELEQLYYNWPLFARPEQLAPLTSWQYWVILAGRGFGKTRTGAEWVRYLAENKKTDHIALIGPTALDVKNVMIMGESGIINISPPWMRPKWEGSKNRLIWPNGVQAFAYSADEPNRLRGPQHGAIWADEVAAWRYPESWDMAVFGLRLGDHPQAVITTTPKPTALIKNLIKHPKAVVTKGSTYDNKDNLPKNFIEELKTKYEGSRLGAQEIYAEIVEENKEALWNYKMLENYRLDKTDISYERIIIAVDPAVTHKSHSDETGIIVVGKDDKGHGYILQDASGAYKADEWIKKVISLYYLYKADRIVAEVNQGGDLVENMLRLFDQNIAYKSVRATRGKMMRAEPIATLYERGKIHHMGYFYALEKQMCEFTGKKISGASPDRLDALVWGLTELFMHGKNDCHIWEV